MLGRSQSQPGFSSQIFRCPCGSCFRRFFNLSKSDLVVEDDLVRWSASIAASVDIRLSWVKWILQWRYDSIMCRLLNIIDVSVSALQCFFTHPAIAAVLSTWRIMCLPSNRFGIEGTWLVGLLFQALCFCIHIVCFLGFLFLLWIFLAKSLCHRKIVVFHEAYAGCSSLNIFCFICIFFVRISCGIADKVECV